VTDMSYLSTIERYHEYHDAIRELLASIMTGVDHPALFSNENDLKSAMCDVKKYYPFVELIYTLDEQGRQTSENVACSQHSASSKVSAKGKDRSQRPYYLLAHNSDHVVVTEPYLSSAGRNICISAALKTYDKDGKVLGYLVVDIDLARTIEYFMGDVTRRRFTPFFYFVYALIAIGLFSVVAVLLYSAFEDIYTLFSSEVSYAERHLKPFGVIIYLTLGLAVFDLGKTILEEEVLMRKDIFRHSSTRRTITRFIAAILIAVSIEALLMMFKSALSENDDMIPAVLMMTTAIGLLIGLGIYVYLGSKAEIALTNLKRMENR